MRWPQGREEEPARVDQRGEYYNKGLRCLWIRALDGTTYKLIVCDPESAGERKIELPEKLEISAAFTPVTDKHQRP